MTDLLLCPKSCRVDDAPASRSMARTQAATCQRLGDAPILPARLDAEATSDPPMWCGVPGGSRAGQSRVLWPRTWNMSRWRINCSHSLNCRLHTDPFPLRSALPALIAVGECAPAMPLALAIPAQPSSFRRWSAPRPGALQIWAWPEQKTGSVLDAIDQRGLLVGSRQSRRPQLALQPTQQQTRLRLTECIRSWRNVTLGSAWPSF